MFVKVPSEATGLPLVYDVTSLPPTAMDVRRYGVLVATKFANEGWSWRPKHEWTTVPAPVAAQYEALPLFNP